MHTVFWLVDFFLVVDFFLGVVDFFKEGIYGGTGNIATYSKEKVIGDLLRENNLRGPDLVVFGDGPVEIFRAKAHDAIAVGVASDEVGRCGWNRAKVDRLTRAGCDILIPDFKDGDALIAYLLDDPAV